MPLPFTITECRPGGRPFLRDGSPQRPTRGTAQFLDASWEDAVASERLILVTEWAAARNLSHTTPYEVAVTPDVLDAVEAIPFAEIHSATQESRMLRLMRQVGHLVDERLRERPRLRRSGCLSFEFVTCLRTRSAASSCRTLRVHLDPEPGRVTVSCVSGAPEHTNVSRSW